MSRRHIVTRAEYEADPSVYPTHVGEGYLGEPRVLGLACEVIGWCFRLHDLVSEVEIQPSTPGPWEATIILSVEGTEPQEAAIIAAITPALLEETRPIGAIYHVKARRDLADMFREAVST